MLRSAPDIAHRARGLGSIGEQEEKRNYRGQQQQPFRRAAEGAGREMRWNRVIDLTFRFFE
jgi:hypothetical protein